MRRDRRRQALRHPRPDHQPRLPQDLRDGPPPVRRPARPRHRHPDRHGEAPLPQEPLRAEGEPPHQPEGLQLDGLQHAVREALRAVLRRADDRGAPSAHLRAVHLQHGPDRVRDGAGGLRGGRDGVRAAVRDVRGAVRAQFGAGGAVRDDIAGADQCVRQGRRLRVGSQGLYYVSVVGDLGASRVYFADLLQREG